MTGVQRADINYERWLFLLAIWRWSQPCISAGRQR
jgi:hypothetical protein